MSQPNTTTPQRLTPERLRYLANEAMRNWLDGTKMPIETCDGLRAHAAYLETLEWQEIATAPKDGTRILAYFPGNPEPELFFPPMIAVAVWRELSPTVNWEPVDVDQELWRRSITTTAFFESEDNMAIDPTHWMPLPKPPEAR